MSIYTKVADLPVPIQTALFSVGYRRTDIIVDTAEEASPLGAGGDGIRDFCTIVNLSTGEYKTEKGSWGGANIWSEKRVDNDRTSYKIPPNFCVIKGHEGGGRPVYANLIVRPDMVVPWLPAPKALTARQQWIIDVYKKYNARGRKEEFNRGRHVGPSQGELSVLEGLGLLKVSKNGAVSVTTEGKNAASKNGWPEYAAPEE